LDYYYDLSGVGAEFDISLTVRECIHQINNARSKLKDVVNNATELRTQFEVDLAMAVVEHKRPEFRSGRYSWNVIKTFSFRRNSSQEKT
jgi:hypothetical protein